jgi:hypothetical protein
MILNMKTISFLSNMTAKLYVTIYFETGQV